MSKVIPVSLEPDIQPPASMYLAEFLSKEFEPVADILSPILQERGALLIHAATGVGKTMFAAGLAAAINSGGKFLLFECSRPKSVVFCDFECQARTLQTRISGGFASVGKPSVREFKVITPDLSFPEPMPNLSTAEGRQALEVETQGFDVLIIDNISTSFRSLIENDAEGWQELANWILRLRGNGQSVILIQHEGKDSSRGYRGHSKQGDVPDNIVQLKRSGDCDDDHLQFDVHVTKCRHHKRP